MDTYNSTYPFEHIEKQTLKKIKIIFFLKHKVRYNIN